MSKFLLACDKFKGSLSSEAVNQALSEGIISVMPEAQLHCIPVADGGQGMIAALKDTLELEILPVTCRDALNRPRQAIMGWSAKRRHVYLESSESTGLHLLNQSELAPLQANTQGVGDLLLAALKLKPQRIFMGLGSSATCDGGMGALMALGWHFFDTQGKPLPACASSLKEVSAMQAPQGCSIPLSLILDVNNPPTGPRGGIQVYGPQKGANVEQLLCLEQGMMHWVSFWENQTQQIFSTLQGGGAAGGLCLGLVAALNAEILAGAPWLLQQLQFEDKLHWADLVVTGEGAFDLSSLDGKLPGYILNMAQASSTQAILVCGQINVDLPHVSRFALVDYAKDTDSSAEISRDILRQIGKIIAKAHIAKG